MEPSVRGIVGVILLGFLILSAIAVYTFADLTPARLQPEIAEAPPYGLDISGAERLGRERQASSEDNAGSEAGSPAEAARIDAEKQRAAAAEKQAGEEKAKSAALARQEAQQEAQVEDALQAARERSAQRASAEFEQERSAEAARVDAEKQRAAAEKQAGEEKAKSAALARQEAQQEAQVEDALQAARERSAQRASAEFSSTSNRPTTGARPTAVEGAPSNSDAPSDAAGAVNGAADVAAQHLTAALANAQPVIASRAAISIERSPGNEFARKNPRFRWSGAGAESADRAGWLARFESKSGAIAGRVRRSLEARAAYLTPTIRQRPRPRYFGVTSLSDARGTKWRLIFNRRCPSILESSREYDDDLVGLCRKWAERQ